MSEHQIRSLGKTATETLKFLKESFKQFLDALGYLKQLPEFFQNTLTAISESASRQISARGEMEIIQKMAALDSKRFLVHQEKDAIQDFEKQLKEDINYIQKRYNKIDDELNGETKSRVRALDAHLLELPSVFPEAFKNGLSQKIGPLITQIEDNANASRLSRKTKVDTALDELLDSVKTFSNNRSKFFDQIKDYQQQIEFEEDKIYQIPVTLLEKSGKTTAYAPGAIKLAKNINIPSYYTCDENLTEYLKINEKRIVDQSTAKLDWKDKIKERERMLVKLNAYVDKAFDSDKSSIKKAVKKIINNSSVKTLVDNDGKG